MAQTWPTMVLIDPDRTRQKRVAKVAGALGIAFSALDSMPSGRDLARARVRLAIRTGPACRAIVAELRAIFPQARALICGTDPSQRAAIAAFRAGADDFVSADAGEPELASLIEAHVAIDAPADDGGLIGGSAALRAVRDFALKLAPTNISVLIAGETGTGKDCLAAMLHRNSNRANGPLVALNCAAIPEALLEGELFGYERGAFSGAHMAYPGKFKLADKGTLLLDEIGELSAAGQAKVLRAIETGEAYRLGGTKPTRFDVRIVAATNRHLADEIAAGRFREDLFYRLAVAQLVLPPLRERAEDIAPIAARLLTEFAHAAGAAVARLSAAALNVLKRHDWPGNVRELRNVAEIAMVTSRGGTIEVEDLPAYVRARAELQPVAERARLVAALTQAGGNKSEAAKALNCSRMTLYRKLAQMGDGAGL